MSEDKIAGDKAERCGAHPEAMGFVAGHRLRPLIGGVETFAALEKAIGAAKRSVHMAYWTLDPETTTTGDVEEETLGDLLRGLITRGIELRIVVADFDPVIGTAFHRSAWRSYRKLAAIADGLDAEAKKRLSVMCSRHDTRWGPLGRTAAQPILRYKLAEKAAAVNEEPTAGKRRRRLADLPGLWPFITFDGERCRVKRAAFPAFYPAAHHEKLCVIDDEIVFLGGLDITEKRKDDWDHDNDFPWHDVACRLEGPVAAFFARHFRCRWNEEWEDCMRFLAGAQPPEGVEPLPETTPLTRLAVEVPESAPIASGVEVKPLRTLSRQRPSWFSRTPDTQITEIRDAYLEIIAGAERFLYIENQYLRSTVIADALAARARENPQLELILILPLMPEDAFVEDEPTIATRHGQYLKDRNTDLLFEAFGERVGIFCMQMPREDRLPDPEKADPEEIVRNTVYIHAKTLVCDDSVAIIGSANLNGRSLVTDTETAIAWRGDGAVRDYRVALWKHALDIDTSEWKSGHLARWKEIAQANAERDPGARSGFVVPFPRRHLDAHAKKSWLVPDELV